jgi:DNA-binding MarR family transcriptional regulator
MAGPSEDDYSRLFEFRLGIRKFLHAMEKHAAAAGITPAQHQLLLAIRGHGGGEPPSISDLSAHLLLKHHSMVELVNRAEAAGLVVRRPDPRDHRVVRIELSPKGAELIVELSERHLDEVERVLPSLRPLVKGKQRFRSDAGEPIGGEV